MKVAHTTAVFTVVVCSFSELGIYNQANGTLSGHRYNGDEPLDNSLPVAPLDLSHLFIQVNLTEERERERGRVSLRSRLSVRLLKWFEWFAVYMS